MTYDIYAESRFLACPHCGAHPGDPCRTQSGGFAVYPHSSRVRLLHNAFRQGYLEGEAAGVARSLHIARRANSLDQAVLRMGALCEEMGEPK